MYQGALILEGGGFRGVYTAGVLDYLMDQNIQFSDVYGISAGACNALNYLSQNRGRYIKVAKEYCNDPRYMGIKQLVKTGSIFNWQFSFYEIGEKYVLFDYDTFYASPMHLWVGATDCESGDCHWFSNQNGDDMLRSSIASSSMPLLSVIQQIGGRKYLDGGVADSIPVQKALEDGHAKQLIVLTQNDGYVKKPNKMMPMIRRKYKAYPKLCQAMEHRHEKYNQSVCLAKELEQKGQAVILCPSKPMVLKRIEHDVDKLQAAYENGYEDARAASEKIRRLFEQLGKIDFIVGQLVVVQSGKIYYAFYQRGKPLALFYDYIRALCAFFRRETVFNQFRKAAYACQRGIHFVRHVCDKVVFRAFGALCFGYVRYQKHVCVLRRIETQSIVAPVERAVKQSVFAA